MHTWQKEVSKNKLFAGQVFWLTPPQLYFSKIHPLWYALLFPVILLISWGGDSTRCFLQRSITFPSVESLSYYDVQINNY